MKYVKHSVLLSLLTLQVVCSKATAASNPCFLAQMNASRAQRNLDYSNQQLLTSQNAFYDAQNRVSYQLSLYQAYVDQAYANIQASNTINNGFAGACAVNLFFFRRSAGCFSGAIASAAFRRASANAQYNAAIGRRNSYAVFSQGYVRRAAERVNYWQTQVNNFTISNSEAQSQYEQCLSANSMS